ncbi:adenylate kinase-domain-containing protein [Xylaria digitata]|nr:adenylate kinase-domain-containing protein [Xylaria digitata]
MCPILAQYLESRSGSRLRTFKVVGILGGPGSDTGIQYKLPSDAFKLERISIKDILHVERERQNSKVIIGIPESHVLEVLLEAIELFALNVIVIEFPDTILIDRLLLRGRFNSNLKDIRKRFQTPDYTIKAVINQLNNLLEVTERRMRGCGVQPVTQLGPSIKDI